MRVVALALLSGCALTSSLLSFPTTAGAQGASLRFFGHGVDDIDRVKIPIDDPFVADDPGPPVDVGATDFTIELFVRGSTADNPAGAISCGGTYDWIEGNILLDRDRFDQGRSFGLSFGGGLVAFGLNDENQTPWTLCSDSVVLDGGWHHLAVQRRRSDGRLWLHVDGVLEDEADGPDGDLSYPDDGFPTNNCGGPCVNSDPFVVLGAEKHDAGPAYPSFSGWLDELRFSTSLRYDSAGFTPPIAPFTTDTDTAALYHFDEATGGSCTGIVLDVSGASGGPSNGACSFGGSAPAGPVYSAETPFGGPAHAAPAPSLGAGSLLLLVGLLGASGAALRRHRTRA